MTQYVVHRFHLRHCGRFSNENELELTEKPFAGKLKKRFHEK